MNFAIKILSKELTKLIKHTFSNMPNKIMVVGLGSVDTTADSIGPNVIKQIEITRHILKYAPSLLPCNTKEISAISPGVLGTTGIETEEIIKSVSEIVKPDLIIVIDALASNNIDRLLKTIQICNTGITPGSGVNNKRKELSEETLGTKVIAIGVPTVIPSKEYNLIMMPKEIDDLADNLEEIISSGINRALMPQR